MKIDTFYLRVESSVGTFHLPVVGVKASGNDLELVFNWIIFEQDVTVETIQTFALVLKPCSVPELLTEYPEAADEEDYALDDPTHLQPGDGMQFVEALEVGCFTSKVPLSFVRELEPAYKPGMLK